MRALLTALALSLATPATAQSPDIGAIIETHVLPRYQALAGETAALRQTSDHIARARTLNSLRLITAPSMPGSA